MIISNIFRYFIYTITVSVAIFCFTECKEGLYGINCSQQCVGHCRAGATCNHVTGHCDKGCDDGWTGVMCYIGDTRDMI